MKSLFALTALLLSFTATAEASSPQECLPIYLSDASMIQAVFTSDEFQEIDPILALEIPAERQPSQTLSKVVLKRNGSEASVHLTYQISLNYPEQKALYRATFDVEQTCEGKLVAKRI